MVSDNYMWRGCALWIAIGMIAPVLLIESGGCGACGGRIRHGWQERGRMDMMQGNSGDAQAWEGRKRGAWIWKIVVVIMVVQSYGEKYGRV